MAYVGGTRPSINSNHGLVLLKGKLVRGLLRSDAKWALSLIHLHAQTCNELVAVVHCQLAEELPWVQSEPLALTSQIGASPLQSVNATVGLNEELETRQVPLNRVRAIVKAIRDEVLSVPVLVEEVAIAEFLIPIELIILTAYKLTVAEAWYILITVLCWRQGSQENEEYDNSQLGDKCHFC